MEKLYKLLLLTRQNSIYGYNDSKINKIIKNIYKYFLLKSLPVIFIFTELLYTYGYLYYSIYLLFIYPIIYIFFRILNDLACFLGRIRFT